MAVMSAAFDPAYGEAWNRRQVSDALLMPNTYYLLASAGGFEPSAAEPAAGFVLSRGIMDEEELLLIAVHPDHRQRGVGAALMQRFIETATERGRTSLFLEMREGNPAAVLYKRFGFEPVGRRRNYYRSAQQGPLDAITYARRQQVP
ncbi:ribosomal protein S18-alanine N-acetyltransferase [Altererythrobacter soli]|uniref:[Ribosomal protein bS18]-alanine N-acetyltransferase n=2 Tax=Croceibacterium soli TaxID=1739690 RepID=A0A6I4V0U4_9SPHN|nr:ribosomal protein S18-alanine N-acetyltransferase [Croceibacterium soli]